MVKVFKMPLTLHLFPSGCSLMISQQALEQQESRGVMIDEVPRTEGKISSRQIVLPRKTLDLGTLRDLTGNGQWKSI